MTPYVGKRARRDVAPDEQPAPVAQPYVGKRAARPVADSAPIVPASTVPASIIPAPATPYVGKRIARPAVDAPAPADLIDLAAPRPIEAPVPTIRPRVEMMPAPVIEPVVEPVPEPAVAFVKPVAPVALLDVPAPRRSTEWSDWNLFAAESPEDTGQLPFALTEAFTGSMPRIEDLPGTDFSFDTTTTMPAIKTGKRARVAPRRTRLRVLPSLSALVGAAALVVAGAGAMTAGKQDLVRADAGPLRQAGALTGSSAVASIGNRTVSVSRGGGRGAANSAAEAHENALAAINQKASGWAQVLKKNQWGLPIPSGVYHLTARFGDCGLWSHCHTGLDFAAPTGTPIHAISNGVISATIAYDGAYGNKTVETLEDGTELWYAHQVRFGVEPGQEVHAGDVIGFVGSTGHVTGPHVHVEVRPGGGDPVDPYPALVEHGLQP
ncbi:peptidoglycan DD-metalloendopeptidase family protein [Nocardioides terrae]|uniref:peptidoglycan DD-metalloendopeptidase family protein n=1 Tax=Nocardioides terrae TaxID=574651 RepID=UPI000B8557FE|nr:peptidoglycan DD-metalloendopeptidase family protein [Nocardioides terrae]